MQRVIQYTYQGSSQEEAKNVADGLRQLEGCLDAHVYMWTATAHFEMDQGISQETLPAGCRIIPSSVADYLRSRNHH